MNKHAGTGSVGRGPTLQLLVSMWLTRRGKLIGLLCWPGALFYVLYV